MTSVTAVCFVQVADAAQFHVVHSWEQEDRTAIARAP
jgi:hypothetical protein